MNDALPPDEIELARQRLQRSRDNLHLAFHGITGDGSLVSSPVVQGIVLKGVQLLAAGRGLALAGKGIGPAISIATLLLTYFMRGRSKVPVTGLVGSLALAALSFLRRRR